MEKKVKISMQLIGLILISFLLSCGVKGDPQELKIKQKVYQN